MPDLDTDGSQSLFKNLWFFPSEIKIFNTFFGLFRLFYVCFGSIETRKHPVSIFNRNNRNKRPVSDSVKTSFGSSFGCFESKLVSDTLAKSITGAKSIAGFRL
jgi:hypothetical protein